MVYFITIRLRIREKEPTKMKDIVGSWENKRMIMRVQRKMEFPSSLSVQRASFKLPWLKDNS